MVRPAFTRPSFDNLVVVFAGWTMTSGPHAVTQALMLFRLYRTVKSCGRSGQQHRK